MSSFELYRQNGWQAQYMLKNENGYTKRPSAPIAFHHALFTSMISLPIKPVGFGVQRHLLTRWNFTSSGDKKIFVEQQNSRQIADIIRQMRTVN